MIHKKVQLAKKQADGYVIPLGQVNLVSVVTDVGMVGCGAFDVAALNNFGYPAAKVRPSQGSSIATIDDLLDGIIKEVNPTAEKLGLKVGMTGRDALDLL
ncbi:MAG: YunC family protein [Methanotrichaceae archaeon]